MGIKAVIDRFEADKAVIIIGDQRIRMVIPKSVIPKEAKPGDWLELKMKGDDVESADIDKRETEIARKRIEEKINRLKR